MGTTGFQELQSNDLGFVNSLLARNKNLLPVNTLPAEEATSPGQHGGGQADQLSENQAQDIQEAFEGVVYQSRMQQVSLSAQFSEIAARIAEAGADGSSAASFSAQQLSFDFVAESRVEELAMFRQRTDAVAEGLNGARQSTYVEASRQVAARFEMSISISGAALNGFANASEGTQDNGALFDKFTEMSQRVLEMADEFFNEFFTMFEGFTTGGMSGEDMAAQMQEMMGRFFNDDFMSDFMNDFLGGMSGTGDGQAMQFAGIQMEFSFEFSASATMVVQEGQVQQSDPIMLDLDGDGYELTSYKNGAHFDITGSGTAVNTAFVTGGDAFLALDRNGDGQINSGAELFGDQHGARNGFEELRKFDSNGDGLINRHDSRFDELLLFKDNGNGITEEGELISLEEAGVSEIDLGYRDVDERTAGGNRLGQLASFRRYDGSSGGAADAILNYTA